MSPEDELQQFKKKVRRDGMITNIILAITFTISVLFMIYGVIKSIEANAQREVAQMEVKRLVQELQKCQSEKK